MNWRHVNVAWVGLLALSVQASAAIQVPAPADQDLSLMTSCYFRFLVSGQVAAQATSLAKSLPADSAKQVQACSDTWQERQMNGLRASLEKGLGDRAQSGFEQFVADYTQAEKSADAAFLGRLAKSLEMNPAPADYAVFRKAIMETTLAQELANASRFLSEVQTWADARSRNPNVPSLDIWLNRSVRSKPAGSKPAGEPSPKSVTVNLQEAEAAAPDMPQEEEAGGTGPLANFAAKRQEKRDRALKEAEAGMQQVAAERQAAEEEYASKKLSAAQAEAENTKRQAEKMASAEKDAFEQRQNSWGNRLKSIVGSTVGAATGAFAGGIGARAGEEAVNAVFNDRPH